MYLVHLYADGRVKIEPLHYGYGSYLSDRGYLFTSPGKIQKISIRILIVMSQTKLVKRKV